MDKQITSEDIRHSLLPGPDGQTSPSLQLELSTLLDRLRETIDRLSTNKKLAPFAEQAKALVDWWYPHRPWGIMHDVAKERLIAMNIAIYFLEHLTETTPELNLPHGFTLKHAVEGFEITSEALNIAVRYQVDSDSMGPQLMPGTKVLAIKTKSGEWATLTGKVVLINRRSHLNEETLCRVTKVTQRTIYVRFDNRQWAKLAIPRRDIMALYFVSYIVGKKVL